MKRYKLSLTEAEWLKIKPTLQDEIETDEGKVKVWKKGINVQDIGHVPIPETYKVDEEGQFILVDGEKVVETEASFHPDYAVNVSFDGNGEDPVHLMPYLLLPQRLS
jgi:hypothetical protein